MCAPRVARSRSASATPRAAVDDRIPGALLPDARRTSWMTVPSSAITGARQMPAKLLERAGPELVAREPLVDRPAPRVAAVVLPAVGELGDGADRGIKRRCCEVAERLTGGPGPDRSPLLAPAQALEQLRRTGCGTPNVLHHRCAGSTHGPEIRLENPTCQTYRSSSRAANRFANRYESPGHRAET